MVRLELVRALRGPSLHAFGYVAEVAHELGSVLGVVMFAFGEELHVVLDQLVVVGRLALVLRSQLVVFVVILVVVLLLTLAHGIMFFTFSLIPQSPSMVH